MPLFGTIVDLSSAAKAAGTPLADVTNIAGAYKTYQTLAELNATASSAPDRFSAGQILYISASNELYKVDSIDVDPITFATIVVTSSFSWPGSGGGSTDTGSLLTTASVASNTITFTKGDATTFDITVDTGSNATSASYASTASYVASTISSSYALTASYALNGGGGGGTTDTGSFFTSASSYGPSGSIIFTQGDGSTQTVTVGSSFVTTTLPNSEVILAPTQSYKLIGDNSTWTYPAFSALNPQNFDYSWRYDTSSATFTFRDDTNSEWGDVGAGDYIAFKSSNSSNLPAYYEVTGNTYNSSSYGIIRIIGLTPTNADNVFSAAATASVIASVSVPNVAYSPRISLGYYGGAFYPANNLATNYSNQVALVSGSTPSGSWLYIGNTPSSGSQFSATAGQYVGLSTNTSSFTYYVVNGRSYTNASLDYFIGITPVSGEYFAPLTSNLYIETTRYIPAQPYYNNLSHITYPITPTSTDDASGSIGDVSYDNNNFYVKRNIGWGKAPLLDIDSGSLLTTASVSDNTLTFTKNDGSTFDLTVNTGSGGGSVDTGSLLTTASATDNNITFTKGDASTFVVTIDTGSAVTTDTGSLMVTGSVSLNTLTFTKGDSTTFNLTVDTGSNAISASYALTASYLEGTVISASYALTATSADSATSATSASYALTSSYALNSNSSIDTGSFATTGSNTFTGNQTIEAYTILTAVSESYNYVDDIAAASAGVPLGGLYRNGNVIMIRIF